MTEDESATGGGIVILVDELKLFRIVRNKGRKGTKFGDEEGGVMRGCQPLTLRFGTFERIMQYSELPAITAARAIRRNSSSKTGDKRALKSMYIMLRVVALDLNHWFWAGIRAPVL